jgi:hypothetical protein
MAEKTLYEWYNQQMVNKKERERITAVEWLVEQLMERDFIKKNYETIEQAKAMEKEQTLQSYIEGAEEAKKIFKEELQEFIVLPKDFIYKK